MKTAFARKLRAPQHDAPVDHIPAEDLRKGDVVLVEAGDIIPCDGKSLKAAPRWTKAPSPVNPLR